MADRRPRQWFDADLEFDSLTVGTALVDQLSFAGDEVRTLTVTRLIIDMILVPTSISASNVGIIQCTLGVGVATTVAVTAGVTALPSPTDNAEFPARGWLYKGMTFLMMDNTTGSIEILVPGIRHLDLGAMRKIDNGLLFAVAEIELVSGTAFQCDLRGHVRFLCLT